MARGSKTAIAVGLAMLLVVALAAFVPFGELRTTEQDDVALQQPETERKPLGLMTSLPIYWREAGSFQDKLAPASDEQSRHWVREQLERNYELLPLDSLSDMDGGVADDLAGLEFLLLAQPYTLTPSDNVALDMWLRDGGRLLMFADPMLTEHSAFAIGDRRRPQDVGLVPPVFARWGLVQTVEDDIELGGVAQVSWNGRPALIPVSKRGYFAQSPDGSEQGDLCEIVADRLIADCTIGAGRAVIVADAAMLEATSGDHAQDHSEASPNQESRQKALAAFLVRSFRQ